MLLTERRQLEYGIGRSTFMGAQTRSLLIAEDARGLSGVVHLA